VVTRWGKGIDDPAFAKLLVAVLGSLRGSFCIYQGEELGLPQAEVPFDRLIDPYGITFWPDFKGRDGCRTPMPWTTEKPQGGFSTVEPWLPMYPDHLSRAVATQGLNPDSVLHFYQQFLAWRKGSEALRTGSIHFYRSPEPILALRREVAGERVLAVFNLSPQSIRYTLPAPAQSLVGHGLHTGLLEGRTLHLPPWGGFFGRLV
jgi:alpha-glucosidase